MQDKTLGQRQWVFITEGIQRDKRIREYMESHGGLRPPDTRGQRVWKKLCCVSDKEIDMGSVKRAQEEVKQEGKAQSQQQEKDKKKAEAAPTKKEEPEEKSPKSKKKKKEK
jgi:hypothetical protein